MWRVLKLAARAAVWRTTPDPPLVGLPVLLGFAIVVAAVRIALQLLAAGSWHAFNPYGLNAVVAWIALELAVAALFVRPAGRATALVGPVRSLDPRRHREHGDQARLCRCSLRPPRRTRSGPAPITAGVIYAVAVAWWVGAMACVVQSLESRSATSRRRQSRRALWAALFVANALVPHAPVFLPPDFDARTANWWEVLYALHQEKNGVARASPGEIARIEKAQPALLRGRSRPPRAAAQRRHRYLCARHRRLGRSGRVRQGTRRRIGIHRQRFADQGSNRPPHQSIARRLETVPLADLQNFQAAVHAIGGVMDKDEDVLILLMTSHGEQTGFALQLPGGTAELTPQQVTSALDSEGIKNRVVIVSACYAGIFVPPLANDNTIVMTAADAKNTSFGCAPERDWTYFGDALFRQSLHPGADFENAFDHARVLIHGWELMDHLQPSNPQAHFGPALVAKLAPFFASAQSAGNK